MGYFLVCNTAWAPRYQGEPLSQSGGEYVKSELDGAERFNFQPYEGNYYGYVGTKTRTIDCNKLQNLKREQILKSIDRVIVVWTAKNPKIGGVYVAGWYLNATVFRDLQYDPSGRVINNEPRLYNTI